MTLPETIPASTCFGCSRPGIVSEDQERLPGLPRAGHNSTGVIRFYCGCGRVWYQGRADAELHGRFLDRAGLRQPATPAEASAAVEPPGTRELQGTAPTMRAVLDALADEVQAKTAPPEPPAEPSVSTLRTWRVRELAYVSEQLQRTDLDRADRADLMQRWADLTLLLGAHA